MSNSSEIIADVTGEVMDAVVKNELVVSVVVCNETSDGKADTTDTDVDGDTWLDTGAGSTDCVVTVGC